MAKLTVEFNDRIDKLLSDLATGKGLTKTDVLRRAIALYDYVERETSEDPAKRLSITKDGTKLHDIVTT